MRFEDEAAARARRSRERRDIGIGLLLLVTIVIATWLVFEPLPIQTACDPPIARADAAHCAQEEQKTE